MLALVEETESCLTAHLIRLCHDRIMIKLGTYAFIKTQGKYHLTASRLFTRNMKKTLDRVTG